MTYVEVDTAKVGLRLSSDHRALLLTSHDSLVSHPHVSELQVRHYDSGNIADERLASEVTISALLHSQMPAYVSAAH